MSLIDHVEVKDDGLYWKFGGRTKKLGQRVGSLNHEGYRVFGFNGRQLKEHREVFFIHHGYYPTQIDHINGVRDDNRIENLRPTDNKQNQYNRIIEKGWVKKSPNKYEARISFDGVRKSLGYYRCETAARLAYLKAAQDLYKEWWSRTRYTLLEKNENLVVNQVN